MGTEKQFKIPKFFNLDGQNMLEIFGGISESRGIELGKLCSDLLNKEEKRSIEEAVKAGKVVAQTNFGNAFKEAVQLAKTKEELYFIVFTMGALKAKSQMTENDPLAKLKRSLMAMASTFEQ